MGFNRGLLGPLDEPKYRLVVEFEPGLGAPNVFSAMGVPFILAILVTGPWGTTCA